MSEQPRSKQAEELAGRVQAALVAEPTGAAIDDARQALRGLAEASAGDRGTYAVYQPLLHRLHYGPGEDTYAFRQWLASSVYALEESRVPPADGLDGHLSPEAFGELLKAEQRALSPLNHPLFKYIFEGDATFDEAKIYFEHKWLIILTFWRSFAELGMRLSRMKDQQLENCAPIYENVHEELGDGDVRQAHLVRHHRQLTHIGVPAGYDALPRYPETCEYINYRLQCMRHAEPAWALGSFFSQEATSLEYTMGHYHLLKRVGVPEQYAEIYFVHDSIDTEHTDEILEVIHRMVVTPEQQAICLRSQRRQMNLWHRHFDRVLEEIQALPRT